MIREARPRPRLRPLVAQPFERALGVVQEIRFLRHGRNAGAMREHVPDGDEILAVAAELGDVVGDAILDVQRVHLVELQYEEGGDGLRGGVEDERGVESDRRLRRLWRIVGIVAAGVADGAMQHGLILAADADLQRRMEARAIHRLDRTPEALDVVPGQVDGARFDLLAPRSDRLEIVGDVAESAERTEGLPHSPSVSRPACRGKGPIRVARLAGAPRAR